MVNKVLLEHTRTRTDDRSRNLLGTFDSVHAPEKHDTYKNEFFELECVPTLSGSSYEDGVDVKGNFLQPVPEDGGALSRDIEKPEVTSKMDSDDLPRHRRSILKKLRSPIRAARQQKKRDEPKESREDTSIFEQNMPLDFLDDDRENDSSGYNVRQTMNVAPALPLDLSLSSPTKPGIARPTALKAQSRGKSLDKMIQFLSPAKKEKEENQIDMSIGLRLALPDKIDIMTGSTPIKDTPKNSELQNTLSSSKKLIIVPAEQKNLLKSFRLSAKSPFKKKLTTNHSDPTSLNNGEMKAEDKVEDETHLKNENKAEEQILLRSSELEPSVHQIAIPEATDLLIHARVCALVEGYDMLMESRAKAGKRWFSFGNLVGLSRSELENMYLSAIGKKPEIPLFVGEAAANPPPLPNQGHNPFAAPPLGNPFENLTTDGRSLSSFQSSSINSSESSTGMPNSRFPMARVKEVKTAKPHPSTIKSLLECTDDLIVEGYFNETIGSESDLIEGAESTSVQVTVFSSQRQRQFIICYRGSMTQHTKPVRSKLQYKVDSNNLNTVFAESYFQSEIEPKVFDLIERLSSENPFCDCIFTGHSFGGGLSIIGAVRCAEKYPMMTVSSHVFAVPKVGQKKFRERANGLPNLKIIRAELGQDAYVDLPLGPWEHVGHTISVNYSKGKRKSLINNNTVGEILTATAAAYKFGKKIQSNKPISRVRTTIDTRAKAQGKSDHEMRNYLHAFEQFTHMGCAWVSSFADEAGTGIVTAENEVRLVV